MSGQQEGCSKVNPFTLFLILILLLAASGTLAALADALRPLVTKAALDTYHNKEG
ncbi:MAG TPA: hypothetical protein GX518_03230 [Firmicutes bacterium]|nr:hypothetical protein [Bacillota bacterium]